MDKTDRRKQSIYFPDELITRLHAQSIRLDRSLSWIVQRCLRLSLPDIEKLPGVSEPTSAE